MISLFKKLNLLHYLTSSIFHWETQHPANGGTFIMVPKQTEVSQKIPIFWFQILFPFIRKRAGHSGHETTIMIVIQKPAVPENK